MKINLNTDLGSFKLNLKIKFIFGELNISLLYYFVRLCRILVIDSFEIMS